MRLHRRPIHFLPKVVTALKSNGLSSFPILILERSELFGHGSLVTVFYVDQNGIELQVGNGQVSTVQMDRRIQVEVTHWAVAHQNIFDGMAANLADTLCRLLVKPTVTSGSIESGVFRRIGDVAEEEN